MPIPVTCSQCEKTLNAPDTAAGCKVKCRCGSVLLVPDADNGLSLDDEHSAGVRPRRAKRHPNSTSGTAAWHAMRLVLWLFGAMGAGLLGLILLTAKNANAVQQTGTACEIIAYTLVGFVLIYCADRIIASIAGMTTTRQSRDDYEPFTGSNVPRR